MSGTSTVSRIAEFGERFGLAVLFVAMIIGFSVAEPGTFLTGINIGNVLGNQSILALVGLATLLPLVCGQLDLSLASIVSFTAVTTGSLTARHAMPLGEVIPIVVLAGALVGLVNALLITRVGVNALITTLGMATVLAGVTSQISGGLSIVSGLPAGLLDFGAQRYGQIPSTFLIAVGVALLLGYVLALTPFGRKLALVGGNPEAARLTGLRVDGLVVASFVMAGALAGIAGVLSVAANGVADPQSGATLLLPALAAAFLGATTIRPGRFNVAGTMLAIFFLAFTVNGLNLLGVSNAIESVFNGAALVIAVSISTVVAKRRGR